MVLVGIVTLGCVIALCRAPSDAKDNSSVGSNHTHGRCPLRV